MANFEASSKFTDQVRKFETTDPAHADLFNEAIGALLNNNVFLKKVSEQLIEKIEQHAADKENPHGTNKDQLGIEKVNNTSDKEKPVSTAQRAAIDAAYQQSTGYTDRKIADLINGAPGTLDTLGEIAKAMQDNDNVVDALEAAIGTKASQVELDGHAGNSTIHITETERQSWNNKQTKTGDAKDNVVTFESGDTANPEKWIKIALFTTKEKLSSLVRKISLMASNLKYLYKLIGNTQLSVGDGTITGAINALNTDIDKFFQLIRMVSRVYIITPTQNNSVVELSYDLSDLLLDDYQFSSLIVSSVAYCGSHLYQQVTITDISTYKGTARISCLNTTPFAIRISAMTFRAEAYNM